MRNLEVPSISAVLPAYNEERNIVACIYAMRTELERLAKGGWEIIVVDDGSGDDTSALVQSIFSADARIRIILHSKNLGYGRALRTGLSHSQCDWIFVTDSDMQFYFEDLELLIPFMQVSDVIQGFRIQRQDPVGRIVLGAVYRTLVHRLFKMPVRDPECSFRLIKRSVVEKIPLVCRGPMVPVELIFRAARQGALFQEIGVRHRNRTEGTPSALSWRSLAKMGRDLASLSMVAMFQCSEKSISLTTSAGATTLHEPCTRR